MKARFGMSLKDFKKKEEQLRQEDEALLPQSTRMILNYGEQRLNTGNFKDNYWKRCKQERVPFYEGDFGKKDQFGNPVQSRPVIYPINRLACGSTTHLMFLDTPTIIAGHEVNYRMMTKGHYALKEHVRCSRISGILSAETSGDTLEATETECPFCAAGLPAIKLMIFKVIDMSDKGTTDPSLRKVMDEIGGVPKIMVIDDRPDTVKQFSRCLQKALRSGRKSAYGNIFTLTRDSDKQSDKFGTWDFEERFDFYNVVYDKKRRVYNVVDDEGQNPTVVFYDIDINRAYPILDGESSVPEYEADKHKTIAQEWLKTHIEVSAQVRSKQLLKLDKVFIADYFPERVASHLIQVINEAVADGVEVDDRVQPPKTEAQPPKTTKPTGGMKPSQQRSSLQLSLSPAPHDAADDQGVGLEDMAEEDDTGEEELLPDWGTTLEAIKNDIATYTSVDELLSDYDVWAYGMPAYVTEVRTLWMETHSGKKVNTKKRGK